MADESKDLLTALTESRLPALPSQQVAEREPTEPQEPGEVEVPGRAPDEVVTPREEPPSEEPEQEVALPAGKKPAKAKPEVKKYPIRVKGEDGQWQTVEYTARELEEKGLLENLAITHSKYGQLQDKHNQLLEKVADQATPARTPPQQEQPPPQITNAGIAGAYDAVADAIIQDLTQSKLFEEDFVEAWPRTFRTMVGQMRFAFDKIFTMEQQLLNTATRFEQTLEYLRANQAKIEGQSVENDLNKHLDGLTVKDPKLFGYVDEKTGKPFGLKDPKVRQAFIDYLAKEVQATKEQATGPKAAQFLAKQYIAFNSDTILDAAKSETANRTARVDKRLVTGEGSGTRPPTPGEETMLDRMINNSGRIQQ